MSNTSESVDDKTKSDLKAGHAPAMKVGGMRVAAPRRTSENEDKKTATATETSGDASNTNDNTEGGQQTTADTTGDDNNEASGAVSQRVPAGQVVGGQFVRIQDAFPTDAVKNTHEKHFENVPKHQQHTTTNHHEAKFIVQPRKM